MRYRHKFWQKKTKTTAASHYLLKKTDIFLISSCDLFKLHYTLYASAHYLSHTILRDALLK